MKKYSMIDIPLMSFYSKELYRDVCFNWKGIGFGYLFLLVLICWIPQMFYMQNAFSTFIKNEAPSIMSQVPDVIFTEGVASTQAKQPYIIKDPQGDKAFFVIDTTGSITNLDDANGAIGLLTKNELIIRKDARQTRTFSFKDIKHFTLNQPQILAWSQWLSKYTMLALSPFILIGSFFGKMILMVIYGLIGMAFAAILKTKLSYETLLRLSVVAVTPSMIIGAILQASQTASGLSGLEAFAITMIYLFIGVKFCVGAEPSAEPPLPA